MDKVDKTILRLINQVPMVKEPFAEASEKLGLNQDEIINRLKRMMSEGVIKRFGVSVNQREVGIVANAVVAWKVPQNRVEEAGKALARYSEVTHCYERQTVPGRWDYNLFIVVHGYDRESVKQLAKKLSKDIEVKDYLVLFSDKQLKKTSITSTNITNLERNKKL